MFCLRNWPVKVVLGPCVHIPNQSYHYLTKQTFCSCRQVEFTAYCTKNLVPDHWLKIIVYKIQPKYQEKIHLYASNHKVGIHLSLSLSLAYDFNCTFKIFPLIVIPFSQCKSQNFNGYLHDLGIFIPDCSFFLPWPMWSKHKN